MKFAVTVPGLVSANVCGLFDEVARPVHVLNW